MASYPTDEVFQFRNFEHAGAFVNQNSGERAAAVFVFEQLGCILGQDMVFNLFPEKGKPPAIEEAKAFIKDKKPDLLIVAGGDGTVSLGLDITDSLRDAGELGPQDCPVAVLPMGTGNDLSRSMGFGAGYVKPANDAKKRFARLINRILSARRKLMDRFRLEVTLVPAEHRCGSARAASEENADVRYEQTLGALQEAGTVESFMQDNLSPQERQDLGTKPVYTKSFMNYFSIGFDADVVSSFGRFRDENPTACTSRTVNKMWYGCFGCQAMVKSDSFPKRRVSLVIDGIETKVPSGVKALIVGNMLTYAGGSRLWRDRKDDERFTPIAVDDKRVEVTGLTGVWHMVGVGTKTRQALRIGQGSTIQLHMPANFTMQYDGEPLPAPGDKYQDVCISIHHMRQSLGCELPKGILLSTDDAVSLHAEEVVNPL
ncbi:diacylglycerol kinase [Strigomonas culicis]|uniref:Diacylglycerol kinase n=1 Tax=Strigomonas culicis TaxID=28005 RepID=S9WD49_9TRYP|nr:diacylglycerol kinase [Strigomonas culicis]|eukprot:EPY37071.1 diacylglycerol kinase [Strigomonas culicis]